VLLPDLTTASTITELECAIRIALSLPESKAIVTLAGFPPRPLASDGDEGSSTPLAGLLQPNEVVTVREDAGGEAMVLQGQGAMKQKKGGARTGVSASSSPASGGGGGGKKKKAASSPAISVNAGPNVRTLHGSSGRGGGGGGGGGPCKRRRVNVGVSSEEDIGGLLLSSVGGGAGGGRVGQCMRAVFRKAMDKQFDEAKANARVAAAEGGRYVLEENMEARRGDGSCARLKVTYHKGLGFQSNFEDDVELLTKAQLLGVVGSVLADNDAREMLKPGGMAGCSPRVFWSLLFHCGPSAAAAGGAAAAAGGAAAAAGGAAGGVEAALRRLVPGQDWGFLHERHRRLSEKAMENQQQEEDLRRVREEVARQKREQREARLARKKAAVAAAAAAPGAAAAAAAVEGGGGGGGGKKEAKKKEERVGTAGAEGAEEKEEEEVVVVEPNEREVRAQAALARVSKGGGEGGEGAAAATAAAVSSDEDEEEGEVDSDFPEDVSDAWVKVLRSPSFNLPTCAALAAADAEELTPRLEEHFTRKGKAVAPSKPTVEEVQKWVSACQSYEMDSMMMLLAGGDEDLLEALECVHVATPKDVRLWAGSVPGALLDMLEQDLREDRLKEKVKESLPDLESVREMGRKADAMMQKHDWLDLWGSE